MIILVLIDVVTSITGWIDGLLPHLTMPSWLSAGVVIPSGAIDFIAAGLHTIQPLFPSAILAEILVGVMALWPAVAAYVVFQWIYRHIPVVAGFGLRG